VLKTKRASEILLALEPARVPFMLDLLQTEAKGSNLNHKYSQKCTKCLRLLVNKYHILPPSLFINNITLESLRVFAVGGYSDIHKGIFQTKSVCLKVLKMYVEDNEEKRNQSLYEFYKETLLWTQLNHPNLLPFFGVNTVLFPGRLALVAPWMVNGQITKFLEMNPNHDRLKVISEIAAGIMYLHSCNIVHGDIKGV
ncbi:kinase-like protein, partial [Marasmius fiardii PR-910]